METFTLSCTNEDCPWEDDREFNNRQEAEEAAESECCPQCDSDLIVI